MIKNVPLEPGKKAPDFTLKVTPDQTITLSELAGKTIVLVFYPADFSPVCSDEMTLFNEILPEFKKYDALLFGISVDNVWSHLAFAKDRNLHFQLLSDFHPKGEVSKLYNAYRESDGESERAEYVINQDGIVSWGYIAPIGINPGAAGVLQALDLLASIKR